MWRWRDQAKQSYQSSRIDEEPSRLDDNRYIAQGIKFLEAQHTVAEYALGRVEYAPISNLWPSNLFHDEIEKVLNKGFIIEDKLSHLRKTLHNLSSESARECASRALVMDLPYDAVERIDFPGKRVCLTDDFVHGARRACAEEIRSRGGLISASIAKSVNYFLIGSLGQ